MVPSSISGCSSANGRDLLLGLLEDAPHERERELIPDEAITTERRRGHVQGTDRRTRRHHLDLVVVAHDVEHGNAE